MNNMSEFMTNVMDELTTLGVVTMANLILVLVVCTWLLFNEVVKKAADKFYDRLEERKKEKESILKMGDYIEHQFDNKK
jgi:hypothetical protein